MSDGRPVSDEHAVARINDGWYVCECGQSGAERWAILHQFPNQRGRPVSGMDSIDGMFHLRSRVWATRDACSKHYPRYCPPGCPSAGKHDADLPDGLCECHQCRTAEADQ